MSANLHTYKPTFEIAVLKSLGEAGEQGKRDVLIKIESGKEDLNESVHSLTIPEINQTNLSLKLIGFDIYEDDAQKGFKTLSGKVFITAKINGEEIKEYLVHSPIVPISPLNHKSQSFPTIQEVKKYIENAWYTAFGEALSDIIDQTTVITGNVSAFNPYSLELSDTPNMSNPNSKHPESHSGYKSSKIKYWSIVGLITVITFIVVLGGIKFVNQSSNDQIQQQSTNEQAPVAQVPYDESQDVQNQGSLPGIPEMKGNDAESTNNSTEDIESELLDEFGLESNVSLD